MRVTGGPMPGTGFFVAPGKILTCVHVIGDSDGLVVRWERNGRPVLEVPVSGRAAVLANRGRPMPALDRDYPDIAVLEVGGLGDHPCVEIDHEWPSSQDSFLIFGYPKEGGAVQLTPARLTYRGPHSVAPTAYLDLASDTIKPGMSGAALLNLRTGVVSGVVVASKHPAHPDGALAIPWSGIAADLGEVLDANRVFHLSDRRWDEASAAIPGHKGKFSVYLRALIDWLGSDPWAHDSRFGGPVLTPAAIERKLRVTAKDPDQERDFDADDLTRQCQRLVILGGPGSGKTWLAKRTARRCAEDALKGLAAGKSIDEVELPLYTTCSRLFSAVGDIREATVTSALHQLGDLGGSRISAALGESFTERKSPTLLVIDSLDEAHGPDERLRQVDTLPWRIVLTSRPNAWNHQLLLEEKNDSHRIGELQPLRYPDDIEFVIHRWFAGRPDWGQGLVTQIARRPDFQQAATVPLILAFYCILGGDKPLPDLRHDLYTKVLNRMLTGRWRGSDNYQPGKDTLLQTLRAWAWSGANRHPVSGIGTWADDIPTPLGPVGQTGQATLDHIATPLGPPDVDNETILRRFIHRSIREHLTAGHIATQMNAQRAAEELLNHLWYDPDWEYTAPAALAMHPDRDQVLEMLICGAARAERLPDDVTAIDGCGELRRFLRRVAGESRRASWTPESAKVISWAEWGFGGDAPISLPTMPDPPTMNSQRRHEILTQLEGPNVDPGDVLGLARELTGLDAELADVARARTRVLDLLGPAGPRDVDKLVQALAMLGPDPANRVAAGAMVLELLDIANAWDARSLAKALPGLGLELGRAGPGPCPGAEPARHRRPPGCAAAGRHTARVGSGAGRAGPGPCPGAGVAAHGPAFQRSRTRRGAARVGSGPAELARARARVLDLLHAAQPWDARKLAGALARLDPEPSERARACAAVLDLLDAAQSWQIRELAEALVELGLEPMNKAHARAMVLDLLDAADTRRSRVLTLLLTRLHAEPSDLARARARVLDLLDNADASDAQTLVGLLAELGPEPSDMGRARAMVLDLLDAASGYQEIRLLREALTRLTPEPSDMARTRTRILDLLDTAGADTVVSLLAELGLESSDMVQTLPGLGPVPLDKTSMRARVLDLLDAVSSSWEVSREVQRLVQALIGLGPVPSDMARARTRILDLLDVVNAWDVGPLAQALIALGPEASDMARARTRIVDLLNSSREIRRPSSHGLSPYEDMLIALSELEPELPDLAGSASWEMAPPSAVLAAVRRNSSLSRWLEALPELAPTDFVDTIIVPRAPFLRQL